MALVNTCILSFSFTKRARAKSFSHAYQCRQATALADRHPGVGGSFQRVVYEVCSQGLPTSRRPMAVRRWHFCLVDSFRIHGCKIRPCREALLDEKREITSHPPILSS